MHSLPDPYESEQSMIEYLRTCTIDQCFALGARPNLSKAYSLLIQQRIDELELESIRKILSLVRDEKVFWCRREGGSEAYQIHRARIHELIKEGLVFECPDGCCRKDYYLTNSGMEILHDTE